MSLGVEDVASSVEDTLPVRCDHHIEVGAVIVDEVVWVKQQVQVFDCFSQEKGFHAIIQPVVPQVFDLQEKK